MKLDTKIIIALIGGVATIVSSFFGYLQGVNRGKESGQEAHTVPLNQHEKK